MLWLAGRRWCAGRSGENSWPQRWRNGGLQRICKINSTAVGPGGTPLSTKTTVNHYRITHSSRLWTKKIAKTSFSECKSFCRGEKKTNRWTESTARGRSLRVEPYARGLARVWTKLHLCPSLSTATWKYTEMMTRVHNKKRQAKWLINLRS